MLYLNEDSRTSPRFSDSPSFFSREVTSSDTRLFKALALQMVADQLLMIQRNIQARPINMAYADTEIDILWEKVVDKVGELNDANGRREGGAYQEEPPSVPVTVVATKPPSRKPLKKKV